MVTTQAIHLTNRRSKETAKSASQSRAAEEERVAALCFRALVPHPNQIEAAGEHARLEQAQEKSSCQESTIACHQTLAYRHQSEKEHAKGKPNIWAQPLEKDIGRDLEDDVRDEEHRQRSIELHTREIEVTDDTERLGICNVDTVEEGQKVEDAEKGNDAEVNSRHKVTLGGMGRAWHV